MGPDRLFVPLPVFNEWLSRPTVRFAEGRLWVPDEGVGFVAFEAMQLLAEVSGTPDRHDLVGRAKTIGYLQELGADILGDSVVIDDNAYDALAGWLLLPQTGSSTTLGPVPDGDAKAPLDAAQRLLQFLMDDPP
jgi:hypothetical protein